MCLGILLLITALNLRGLGESARAFLVPTARLHRGAAGHHRRRPRPSPRAGHGPARAGPLVPTHDLETVGVFLVLKAFSAGCSALTGVEAIANGVPLFKEPRVARAKRTELLLGMILATMLLGLAVLAKKFQVQPRTNQTALSQIMGEAVGRHWAYYIVSLTITLVLALAANTSFGGLPVLTSLLVAGQLPAPPLRRPRQPAGLRQRRLGPGGVLRRAAGGGGRQHQHPDPPVRHRRVHRLHPVPGRPRGPLAPHEGARLGRAGRHQRRGGAA